MAHKCIHIIGLHTVLHQRDGPEGLLSRYVKAESTLQHILKLLPTMMSSTEHEMMSDIVWLMALGVKCLAQADLPAAIQVSKVIINDYLKAVYRCLSSGNPACLTAALDLLRALCLESTSISLLVAVLDFSHKGFPQAARTRKCSLDVVMGTSQSPRAAYMAWLEQLMREAEYESLVLLSRSPAVVQYALSGLYQDDPEIIKSMLDVILRRLVNNEEDNRNLPVAFLRGGQLSVIAKLMKSPSSITQEVVRSFLSSSFSTRNKGLCYPSEPVNVLRNKLLYDLIVDLDPLNTDQGNFTIELVANCPDVAWAYLISGKMSFEPSPSIDFALTVALAIKMFNLLPITAQTPPDAIIPRTLHRGSLSKGLQHEDRMVRFNTLLLMLAILRRFNGNILEIHCPALNNGLPDFRTLYNSWRQHPTDISTDEEEFLEQCYLEVITLYYTFDLVDPDAPIIRMSDFCKNVDRPDVSNSIVELLKTQNPIMIISSISDVDMLMEVISTASKQLVPELLSFWLYTRELASMAIARCLCKDASLWRQLLMAIHDIYHMPLLFPPGQDPLLQYLRMDAPLLEVDTLPMEEIKEQHLTPPAYQVPTVIPTEEEYLSTVRSKISASSPVNFLNSLFAVAKRSRVMDSWSFISPSTPSNVHLPMDLEELLRSLLIKWDLSLWLRTMAAAFDHPDSPQIDLRGAVESALLGYALIGMSLMDIELRKLSHLILHHYAILLSSSRLRERRQIALLLESVANLSIPEAPLEAIPRLDAYFYAEALSILLRPEHPLYRPINELLLQSQCVPAPMAFNSLFLDSNDDWNRELQWALGWIDRAVGRDGQFKDQCNLLPLHVEDNCATLLLTPMLDTNLAKIATRILQKCHPTWLIAYKSIV